MKFKIELLMEMKVSKNAMQCIFLYLHFILFLQMHFAPVVMYSKQFHLVKCGSKYLGFQPNTTSIKSKFKSTDQVPPHVFLFQVRTSKPFHMSVN